MVWPVLASGMTRAPHGFAGLGIAVVRRLPFNSVSDSQLLRSKHQFHRILSIFMDIGKL